MKKFLLIISLIIPSIIFGQSRLKLDFTEYDLDNGLHVILHQDKSVPNVVVGVKYHVGSKNEPTDRSGIAHFIEHVQFHGTKNIPQGKFEKIIMDAGGYCNAYTHYDVTYFYELMPAHEYKLALWAESERMLHPVVTQEGLDTEREIVIQERNMRYYKGPLSNSYNEIMSGLYNPVSYGHSMIGKLEDLKATSVEDIRNFTSNYYSPCNACLVLSGNIDIKESKKWINYYFKDIPKGKKVVQPTKFLKPDTGKEKVIEITKKDLKNPAILIAYNATPETDKDSKVLNIISTLLYFDSSSDSYLKNNILDKDKNVENITSSAEIWEKVGFLKINVKLKENKNIKKVISDIQKQLDLIKKQKVDPKKLQEVKNRYENELVEIFFDNRTIADQITNFYHIQGNASELNNYINRFTDVTAEDIQRVARKYFTQDNRTIIIYLPEKN